jgi:hypothetical protein
MRHGVPRKFIDQTRLLPSLPQADLTPAVGGYFKFVQRMVGINRDLTVKLGEVARAHFGAVGEQAPHRVSR